MRQSDRRAATPFSAEPRWPAGYIRVRREAGAQEKTIAYCVGRVRRFFAESPGRRRRNMGRTEIEVFLAGLASRAGATNWHVQQARDSLELYYEQFRGIALAPRPDVPDTHVRPLSATQAVPPDPPVPKPPGAGCNRIACRLRVLRARRQEKRAIGSDPSRRGA
jgi:hypothetical protein